MSPCVIVISDEKRWEWGGGARESRERNPRKRPQEGHVRVVSSDDLRTRLRALCVYVSVRERARESSM